MPALPEKGVKSVSELIMTEGTSWSTALAICTTDLSGGRRRGSGWCKSKSSAEINYHLI